MIIFTSLAIYYDWQIAENGITTKTQKNIITYKYLPVKGQTFTCLDPSKNDWKWKTLAA